MVAISRLVFLILKSGLLNCSKLLYSAERQMFYGNWQRHHFSNDSLLFRLDIRWLPDLPSSGRGVIPETGVLARGILRLLPGLRGLSHLGAATQKRVYIRPASQKPSRGAPF